MNKSNNNSNKESADYAKIFSSGFTVVATIGLGTFFIDGIILSCFAYFFSGVSMDPGSLFTFPFIVGIINSALTIMFNFDDEETYYRNIIKKRLRHGQ